MNKYNYNNLTPFKWFVLENFPFIEADFDAITNYQLYCKIVEYLNSCIANVNDIGNQMENVTNAFIVLKDYVDNYFENLDVQEEINNKLDEMTESGVLTELIGNYVNPFIEDQNEVINNFKTETNNKIEDLTDMVEASTSGSPAGVYASVSDLTTADPDHSRIYVVSANGHWYYYSNNQWNDGGLYQSSGIDSSNTQLNGINIKSSMLPFNYGYEKTIKPSNIEQGNILAILTEEISFSNNTTRCRTEEDHPLSEGEYYIFSADPSVYSFYVITTDSENICESISGWVTSRKVTIGSNKKGFLILRKTDNSTIEVAEAIDNIRILSGSTNYNIPKIVTKYPVEIDTVNRTITIKSNTIIYTPFTGNINISNDIVLTYNNTNNLLYKLVYDTENKTIKLVENSQSITYTHILLGFIGMSVGRINFFCVNAPYVIDNEDFKFPHSPHFNCADFEILNIIPRETGIDNTSTSAIRVSTTNYINFKGKINIVNKDTTNYKFAYRVFSKSENNYEQISDSGWITSENRIIDVTNNYTVPIFAKVDNSSLSSQEVLKNFDIQPIFDVEQYSIISPRLQNFHSVGHQGCIDSAHRGNSKSAFIYASKNGRTDIECDCKLTSDNVIVLNHDDTITDDNNQTITIANVTYEELLTHTFNGETIASLEDFLQICKKYGTNAYIDHLHYVLSNSIAKNEMIRLIRKYRMEKRVTFLTGVINWSDLLSYFPSCRLLEVKNTGSISSTDIENALALKTDTNEVGFDLNYSNFYNSTVLQLFDDYSDINLEFWTVNNLSTYKEILPISNGITSNVYTGYNAI